MQSTLTKKKAKKCIRKKEIKEPTKKQSLSNRKVSAKTGSRISSTQAVDFDRDLSRLVENKRVNNHEALLPEDIVEDARDPGTSYHNYIWGKSVTRLAMERRIELARYIVRSIVIVDEVIVKREPARRKEIRKYQTVIDPDVGKTIENVKVILRNPDYTNQMITEATSKLRHWYDTYYTFTELSTLTDPVKTELEKFEMTHIR